MGRDSEFFSFAATTRRSRRLAAKIAVPLGDLRQRDDPYRAIFEGSLDGLFLWDESLCLVDVNPAGSALYGHPREEMVGRRYPTTLPLKQVKERLTMLRGALAGETTHVETSVLRPDGTRFDADLRIMPFKQRGRPHALAVVRDISERIRRDQVLRDSEEQYRAIFNASVDSLVLRDEKFRIVDVNATYESMSGFAREEVLGVNHVVAYPPDVRQTIRLLHERALAGEAVRLETELLRRDGQRFDLDLRGVRIQHRGQAHVLFTGRDITLAKCSERALRASQGQYRAIFDASADALVLRDADYRAIEVNPAYLAMFGYTRDEVLEAHSVSTQVDPVLRSQDCTAHERALHGEEQRLEVTATRKDGSTLQVEVRVTPSTYGARPHVLYVVRDITERHLAEQRRRELERQLRQVQKMEAIGHLTGGIAHDFNNILTSVIGYIAMSQERAALGTDAVLGRQLGHARLAAQHACDHVAQLLAFSRPRRGERRLVLPASIARQALQLLRPNLPSSIAVGNPELPPEGESAVPPLVADPVQLEQVLFNLCINARDAIEARGNVCVRIGYSANSGHCASCGTRLDGLTWVRFEVADNGRGMPPEVIEHMFEPFFTTKEAGRGTGMGLAMVHAIVHDHGGHVQVESEPGAGSVMRILLPPAPENAAADAQENATQAVDPAGATLLNGRVLLVEDEPMVGDYMAELMTGWGLEVVLERDPLGAAARIESGLREFDVMVTDQTMPNMTGLELAGFASRHCPDLVVVICTGDPLDIDSGQLARNGVAAWLPKPTDPAALFSLLRELIR